MCHYSHTAELKYWHVFLHSFCTIRKGNSFKIYNNNFVIVNYHCSSVLIMHCVNKKHAQGKRTVWLLSSYVVTLLISASLCYQKARTGKRTVWLLSSYVVTLFISASLCALEKA